MDDKQICEMANILKMLVAAQDLPYFLAVQETARDWLNTNAEAVNKNRWDARWGRQQRFHAERETGHVIAESYIAGQQKLEKQERSMMHGD